MLMAMRDWRTSTDYAEDVPNTEDINTHLNTKVRDETRGHDRHSVDIGIALASVF